MKIGEFMPKIVLKSMDRYLNKKPGNKKIRELSEIERELDKAFRKKKPKKLNCVATDKCQINFTQE